MIQERVTEINKDIIVTLSKITRIDSTGIKYNTLIREELGIDSLMAIEILAKIEKQLDIIIEETHLVDVNTVGDFVKIIEKIITKGK